MSRLLQTGFKVLLTVFLLSQSAVYVEAACGECFFAHTCITNSTFQLCYDGVANSSHSFTCPPETPVCSQFGSICLRSGNAPACGDISKCGLCDAGQIYACTSRTTFGRCDGQVLMPERSPCPEEYFCSVKSAASGEPCVLVCDPEIDDTCDRINENTNPSVPTANPNTTPDTNQTTDSGTTASVTPDPGTTPPTINPNALCQTKQKAGRYAIPNDTDCTSFINCFFRGSAWQGNIVACQPAKPYFNAASACGTVKPTNAGCLS